MQIKKYLAASLTEAAKLMKQELGENAIILSSKVIEPSPKTGRKKMFELTAGIEDEYDVRNSRRIEEDEEEVEEEQIRRSARSFKKTEDDDEYEKRAMELLNKLKSMKKQGVEKPTPVAKPRTEDELKRISEILSQREIQKHIITRITDQLKKYRDVISSKNIENYILTIISTLINTHNFELKKRSTPIIVSLVGPTGVGKTTCIAKLAVISKILHNLDVGLLSLDTYRLGAIDQLRIFSEVSKTDMLVAYEPKDIPSVMNSFKKKDIIFIDTAGRSQRNASQLQKNLDMLKHIKIDETFLVLSATNSLRNLIDVSDKFKAFNYKSLIFTKIDEAAAFGNILNLTYSKNLPVSFLSNGQVIPDDIISADQDFIANMIFNGTITR